jgi:hypothetical protein
MADDEHGGAGDRSGAQSKSFGRSTFRSSFMGASALLPKQREGEDLPLQSDDDEGEQEKENALATRQAPASFFAMGATQPTQLDTQMTIAETETELQVGRPRPSIDQMDDASSGEEEDLDDDNNNLQMEEEEETEPVALAPVVYATSGRMKVLGAIPSSALASLSSSNKKKKNKNSVGAETNKRGGKVTPRAAVPASVGATQAARLDGEGPSGPKVATRPTFSNAQIADAVNNLFTVYGDASSDWLLLKWHQEVCIELNTPYNPEDRVLKASVKAVVTNCEAISKCVSQVEDAVKQSQAEAALLKSQADDAQAQFERYTQDQDAKPAAAPALDAAAQAQMKQLYRKLAMRLHPDRVEEDEKTEAQTLFQRLQTSYEHNDFAALLALEQQVLLAPQAVSGASTGPDLLRGAGLRSPAQQAAALKERLAQHQRDRTGILRSATWQTLSTQSNWTLWFTQQANYLQAELQRYAQAPGASPAPTADPSASPAPTAP